jgi:hypothetical protein
VRAPFLASFAKNVLLRRRTGAAEDFAAEEAEVGYGVGDGEAFGVVVGVEADGLKAVGDGGLGGFYVVAKLQRVQFHEGGVHMRLPVGIEMVRGRMILLWTILLLTIGV